MYKSVAVIIALVICMANKAQAQWWLGWEQEEEKNLYSGMGKFGSKEEVPQNQSNLWGRTNQQIPALNTKQNPRMGTALQDHGQKQQMSEEQKEAIKKAKEIQKKAVSSIDLYTGTGTKLATNEPLYIAQQWKPESGEVLEDFKQRVGKELNVDINALFNNPTKNIAQIGVWVAANDPTNHEEMVNTIKTMAGNETTQGSLMLAFEDEQTPQTKENVTLATQAFKLTYRLNDGSLQGVFNVDNQEYSVQKLKN